MKSARINPSSEPSPPKEEGASGEGADSMKRAAAAQLIERYYFQLTEGCGNSACSNTHCVSSGKVDKLVPNEAAARALQLLSQKATLCGSGSNRSKVPRTQSAKETTPIQQSSSTSPTPGSSSSSAEEILYLTEEKLIEIVSECKESNNYSKLIKTIGQVFYRPDSMNQSFRKETPSQVALSEVDMSSMNKEYIRQLEGELDKDIDSLDMKSSEEEEQEKRKALMESDEVTVDIESVRRGFKAMFDIGDGVFDSALINGLVVLFGKFSSFY